MYRKSYHQTLDTFNNINHVIQGMTTTQRFETKLRFEKKFESEFFRALNSQLK